MTTLTAIDLDPATVWSFVRTRMEDGGQAAFAMVPGTGLVAVTMENGMAVSRLVPIDETERFRFDRLCDGSPEFYEAYGFNDLGGKPSELSSAIVSSAWVGGKWRNIDLTDRLLVMSADQICSACADIAAAKALGVLFDDGIGPGGEAQWEPKEEDTLWSFIHDVQKFFGCDLVRLDDATIADARLILDAVRPPLPADEAPKTEHRLWVVTGTTVEECSDSSHTYVVATYGRRHLAEHHARQAEVWCGRLRARYGREFPAGSNPWHREVSQAAFYQAEETPLLMEPVRQHAPTSVRKNGFYWVRIPCIEGLPVIAQWLDEAWLFPGTAELWGDERIEVLSPRIAYAGDPAIFAMYGAPL